MKQIKEINFKQVNNIYRKISDFIKNDFTTSKEKTNLIFESNLAAQAILTDIGA